MDITTLAKYKKKIDVVVMDPMTFHRESLVHVLRESLADRINITAVVSSLSEIMHLIMLKSPADVYIMEPYGLSESYKSWNKFTHFMASHYPSATCLIWTSKPTMFLKKLNAFEGRNLCWQIPKRIGIDCFVRFLTRILDDEDFTQVHEHACIGTSMPDLTCREIVIITGIVEGYSIKNLAKKYGIAYKTVSTHKRNAMIKMRISSIAQLRRLYIDGYIIRSGESQYLPIESSSEQFFKL